MSDLLQPGLHLDPDALSAFAEGVLPAHERSLALTHLAACEHCRQILFLTQQAAPLPPPAPAPSWTRWLNSVPMLGIGLGAAVLAGAALIFVTLRPHPAATPSVAARVPETLQHPSPAPAMAPATPAKPPPSPPPSILNGMVPESSRPSALKVTGFSSYERSRERDGALAPEGNAKPLPPIVAGRAFLGSGSGAGIGRAPTVAIPAPVGSMAMSSSQGYVASRADSAVDGLQSPAAAPQPTAVTLGAAAAPAAPPPSFSESVTVQTAAALSADSVHLANALPMAAAAKRRTFQRTLIAPAPLPSKLPAAATVSSGQRTLATDTAGALFLSLDSGLHWTPVAAQWPGNVAQLRLAPRPQTPQTFALSQPASQTAADALSNDDATAPAKAPPAPALFQLVTTTGAVWLSPDGLHWQPQ